ncbi:MAG: hypothetical protein ACRDLF_03575 [Solirubrobacteraceae bacterium]
MLGLEISDSQTDTAGGGDSVDAVTVTVCAGVAIVTVFVGPGKTILEAVAPPKNVITARTIITYGGSLSDRWRHQGAGFGASTLGVPMVVVYASAPLDYLGDQIGNLLPTTAYDTVIETAFLALAVSPSL